MACHESAQAAMAPICFTPFIAGAGGSEWHTGPRAAMSEQEREQREQEQLDRVEAAKSHAARTETSNRPLELPNRLYLVKPPTTHPFDRFGVQISTFGGQPLFVGFRKQSFVRDKVKSVKLCQGDRWYGTYAGPFLTAEVSGKHHITAKMRPDGPTGGRRILEAVRHRRTCSFHMEVPDPDTEGNIPRGFEWHHPRSIFLRSKDAHARGSVLVQTSTKEVVARMRNMCDKNVRSDLCGALEIEYVGPGCDFGGSWKIMAFVFGVFGS